MIMSSIVAKKYFCVKTMEVEVVVLLVLVRHKPLFSSQPNSKYEHKFVYFSEEKQAEYIMVCTHGHLHVKVPAGVQ
jgi:hypothetical protein